MRRNTNILAHVTAFVTAAVWGTTFISTKVLILNGITPVQIFTLRFALAYMLIVALSLAFPSMVGHQGRFRWFADSWMDEMLMLALGVTGGSAYFFTENEALRFGTATNVSLIVCSCPLFTTILFRLFVKGTRLSTAQAIGAILAFVGMVAVVLNGHFVLRLSPLGDSLAFCACLCWAVYSLLMKYVAGRYSAFFITRKVFFYGLLTILPYYLYDPHVPDVSMLLNPTLLFNLLFLGIVASLVCFVVWNWALGQLGAMVVTNYVYVNPITTIIFAAWILNEKITPYFIMGSLMILVGLYLSNRKK
ncbi:MAG: DMT family transporter [Prevotella sp.]|nr:DMT family transporter [Prevotella sp.]MBQ6208900.1 DMT family transporter [Prevotella sp.]